MLRVAQSTAVSTGARVRPYGLTLSTPPFDSLDWLPVLNEQREVTGDIVILTLIPLARKWNTGSPLVEADEYGPTIRGHGFGKTAVSHGIVGADLAAGLMSVHGSACSSESH